MMMNNNNIMDLLLVIILVLFNVIQPNWAQFGTARELEQPTHGLCETITVPMCKAIGYNQTIMPNILRHEKQDVAGMEVSMFYPLVKVNCSPQLKIFLCALYVPPCTILANPIPPCRSVCESARTGCSALMDKFGFKWPDHMACERFPQLPDLCVGPDTSGSTSVRPGFTGRPDITVRPDIGISRTSTRHPSIAIPSITKIPQTPAATLDTFLYRKELKMNCPAPWVMVPKRKYEVRISSKDYIQDCGLPCHNVMFTSEEETFARYWVGVWASLCLVSTLFTLLTFLIDMKRFRYPERPIIFLSGCYFVIALCYVVGFALDDRVSCIKSDGGDLVVSQGTKNEGCTILFMLTYFFTMASSIWWVILTMTWVLAAGLKWGHEAIESNSQYFHLAAWAIPAIKTITIIALSSIDGDTLSGVCFTGLSDPTSLIGYIITPLIVYLILGVIFLIAGFVSLFNIRTVMKHGGTKTNKLEKLMVRIGIFSVLYTVPAIIVIACNIYELLNRDTWMQSWRYEMCHDPVLKGSIPCSTTRYEGTLKRPDFIWFIFKYLGYLVVGITSGFWIWSKKTVTSWANFFNKICCCLKSQPREAAV